VDDQIHNIESTETETGNVETTGVDDNMTKIHVGTENVQEFNTSIQNEHVGTENIQEFNTSIQNEENDPDGYVTIGDINITSEMNASNRQSDVMEEKRKVGQTPDIVYVQN